MRVKKRSLRLIDIRHMAQGVDENEMISMVDLDMFEITFIYCLPGDRIAVVFMIIGLLL